MHIISRHESGKTLAIPISKSDRSRERRRRGRKLRKKERETMGKRKTSITGPQPEQSKRREKQSFSVMEEKSVNHTSNIENNNRKKKKGNVISKNKMEPVEVENIGTSLQTETDVEGKNKECVSPVDNDSQSVKARTVKHLQKNKTTDTAFTNDTVELKVNSSEGSKRSKSKGKRELLALSRSTHKDTSITLQMAPGGGFLKDGDADTSKNVVSLEVDSKSNDERAQLGKGRRKRSKSSDTNAEACSSMQIPKIEEGLKEKDTSKMMQAGSSFTSGILPSNAEITDIELVDKNHGDRSTLLACKNDSLKDVDANADASKNAPSLEIDSKSNDPESSKLGKRKRSRKKRKNKSSYTNTEVCSPVQVPQVEEGLEKGTSFTLQSGPDLSSDIHSPAAKITDLDMVDKDNGAHFTSVADEAGSSKDGDADILKNTASLEIDFRSNDTESFNLVGRRQRKRRKNNSCNINAVACSPLQVPQVEKGLEERGNVGSSFNENLRLPVAKVDCDMEKEPYDQLEVKEASIQKEKGKQFVSEERTSDNVVEQKNEDHLARLLREDKILETFPIQERSMTIHARKKLLVLDLNGLLCDVVHESNHPRNAHIKVGRSSVFKRPFCDDFLKFCFERFVVGVWSSRRKENVQGIVSFIVGDVRNLSFCWDVSQCTATGSSTVENNYKPLVLKELKKLWNNEAADLPWKIGEYSPANTLLIDDSPYKALCNPLHTGIFPRPYDHMDQDDNSLGPGGSLRIYLEGLALADNVQRFVQRHPFGKGEITSADASWGFYKRIISRVERSNNYNNK